VVSGLVAAGGLAAALSTADGLLLTISNAMVRDIYSHESTQATREEQRVILSKFALMGVALFAALVASLKPADILPLVSASFSLAAAAFVPAMVLGIFWPGATRTGAVAGMLAGLGTTVLYMLLNAPALRLLFGLAGTESLWFGIVPSAAGVFGVFTGFAVATLVSLAGRGRAQAGPAAGEFKAAGSPPR
jgi:cation/acetate symporter